MTGRPFGRTRAAIGLAAAAMLVPPWLLLRPESPAARRLAQRFHQIVAGGFGLAPRIVGTPGGPGTLLVANHISWADIVSVAALVDTDFIAKADVAGWPGLGALAARTGTIFVARERRSEAGTQMEAVRQRLRGGRRVLLFPEGTTSDGRMLLPFRSSLFAAAEAARAVQPVTIYYAAPDGAALTPPALGAIAWTGDEALLPNAAMLARQRAGVWLQFHDPVAAADFPSRKALAEHCRGVIDAHYSSRLQGGIGTTNVKGGGAPAGISGSV